MIGEAEWALLGSNPPRNMRLETPPMDGSQSELAGFPLLGGCQATQLRKHRVDLPIAQKPTLTAARWSPVWQDNFVT
jgi:hypothetical protein